MRQTAEEHELYLMGLRVFCGKLVVLADVLPHEYKVAGLDLNAYLLQTLAPECLAHSLPRLLPATRQRPPESLSILQLDGKHFASFDNKGFDGVADRFH